MKDLLPFEEVKREVLVKKTAMTNPEFGCKPDERSIQSLLEFGIINLNKPEGPTSHQVSDYVQKILGKTKAGHSGTLVIKK